jgi:glycosyltransferase involved in cell wall biosynthesis
MAERPELSVLMPLYQNGGTVVRAAESILGQTCRSLELVVVDDGSTDDGPGRVGELAARDSRVRLVRRPHEGIVAALNHGLEACRAPWIARMDADDWSHPERLEAELALLRSDPRLAAVDCRVDLEASAVTGRGMHDYIGWLNGLSGWEGIRNGLFEEAPLVHPATLLRRTAVEAVGGYVQAEEPEDYSLWLRLVEAGWRLGKVERTLFRWADLPGRLTRTDPRCAPRALATLKARMLIRVRPDLRKGVQVWGAGPTGRRFMGHLRRAGVPIARIFDIDPRLIGRDLHGAPIHHHEELPRFRDLPCLVALGQRKAKALATGWLRDYGFTAWSDYLFVA